MCVCVCVSVQEVRVGLTPLCHSIAHVHFFTARVNVCVQEIPVRVRLTPLCHSVAQVHVLQPEFMCVFRGYL